MTRLGSRACVLAGILLCGSLAGCQSNAKRLKTFLQQPRSPVSSTEYHVLPPDRLLVTSEHVPDINNVQQQVRPDGKINLPLIGEIYVAYLTPRQIEESIKKAARDYYEQVDATVQVTGFQSQKIYVFGQVSRPGPIPWTGADTLVDILAQAQPTALAWPEQIHVVRGKEPVRGGYIPPPKHPRHQKPAENEEEVAPELAVIRALAEEYGLPCPEEEAAAEPAEKEMTHEEKEKAEEAHKTKGTLMKVNMMKMVHDGDMSRNVLLRPDDVVYVPPNPFAAVGLALQQLLFPILPAAQSVSAPVSVARELNQVSGSSP